MCDPSPTTTLAYPHASSMRPFASTTLRAQLLVLTALALLPIALFGAWGLWNAVDQQRQCRQDQQLRAQGGGSEGTHR